MDEIFIDGEQSISSDYIKLTYIVSHIGGCKYYNDAPITFQYNNSSDSVAIIQKGHHGYDINEKRLCWVSPA